MREKKNKTFVTESFKIEWDYICRMLREVMTYDIPLVSVE